MVAVSAKSNSNTLIQTNKPQNQVFKLAPLPTAGSPATLAHPSQLQLNAPAQGNALGSFSFADVSIDDIRKGEVLCPGTESQAVKEMQKMLTEAGYPVEANGRFGPMTEGLLKDFQRDNAIAQTGKLGPTTLQALENPLRETAFGRSLAKTAKTEALNLGGYSSLGKCYTGVGQALEKVGVDVYGLSAYMAAEQLAEHAKFKEVKVSAAQLPKLPAGAVVVWDRSSNATERTWGGGYTHGHISVSDGKGHEMSDYIDSQRTEYYASNRFRVFLPK